jgi:hypothetical protein
MRSSFASTVPARSRRCQPRRRTGVDPAGTGHADACSRLPAELGHIPRHASRTLLVILSPVRRPARVAFRDLLAPGKFGVGHRRLVFVDGTRGTPAWAGEPALPSRTLPTEVWYPTTAANGDAAPVEDAPLASGSRFPLVVNSPGLGDVGAGEAYAGIALATHGYVVASPTFPLTSTTFLLAPAGPYLQDVVNQPADVSFLIDQLTTASAPAEFLAGAVDTKRIGVSGLSLGPQHGALTYHPRSILASKPPPRWRRRRATWPRPSTTPRSRRSCSSVATRISSRRST